MSSITHGSYTVFAGNVQGLRKMEKEDGATDA
jgi:hypothetical protein